jgi:hypothetical protein
MRRPIAGVYAAIGRSDRDTDAWHDVWTTGHKESVLTPLLYRMGHICARHPVWVLAVWLVVALTIVGVARIVRVRPRSSRSRATNGLPSTKPRRIRPTRYKKDLRSTTSPTAPTDRRPLEHFGAGTFCKTLLQASGFFWTSVNPAKAGIHGGRRSVCLNPDDLPNYPVLVRTACV